LGPTGRPVGDRRRSALAGTITRCPLPQAPPAAELRVRSGVLVRGYVKSFVWSGVLVVAVLIKQRPTTETGKAKYRYSPAGVNARPQLPAPAGCITPLTPLVCRDVYC